MIKTEASIVGVDELTDYADIFIRGIEVRNLVRDPDVREYLYHAGLPGVVWRNDSGSQEYFDMVPRAVTNLEAARTQMKAGEQMTYLTFERQRRTIEDSGRLICSTTIQPTLPLRQQRLPLRPGYARRLPGMSTEVDTAKLGVNLGVWSDPRQKDFADNIATGVHLTAERLPQGTAAWTLVPWAALRHYPGLEVGLYEGGFSRPRGPLRFWADNENNRSRLRLKALFVAPSFGRLSVANA